MTPLDQTSQKANVPGSDGPGGLRTFLRTFAGLLDQWRVVVGIPLGCVVLATAWALLTSPRYQATTTFIVDSDPGTIRSTSGLAGLASQFGIQVPSGGQSPAFFAELATSREVLLAVAGAHYPAPRGGLDSTVTLSALYKLPPLETRKGLESILKRLRRDVKADLEVTTGIVTVSVTAPGPLLAAAVADTLLAALNRFNLERRQLRSRDLRRFLESRVQEASGDLRAAEDSLRAFREHNRAIAQSPELQLQDDRLRRSTELRQQLYVTLASSYEQARIEEFRDTPSLTVVDPPRPPYDRAWPRRRVLIGAAGLFGLLVGLGIALLRLSFGTLDDDELRAIAAVRSAAGQLPIVRALTARGQRGSR